MKILQMIPAFYPAMAYGGTVKSAYYLSKELVNRGHDVAVYTSDTFDEYRRVNDSVANIDCITVHYFKNIRDYDVIHIHGYRNFQNIFVHYYAKKYSIPYILQAHGSLPYYDQKSFIKKSFDLFCGNRLLRDAKKVIALTQMEADSI